MTQRLCISVTDEEMEFIELMQLSPSGIFKQRLEQIKKDSANYNNKLAALESAKKILGERVFELEEKLKKWESSENQK